MQEVLPATCIICDPRTIHEEHHGKNAQELICKPLNSFHVNKQCGTMPELHNNVGWRFPERPPINTARDHSKEKATPPIWPSSRGRDQSTIQQNAANHHIFHTDHQKIMQQMHSTEEEPCPQRSNKKTQ
ncbi:hypothetical protein TcCL_Unassigned00914 [Trypanosoma cruzi]|nr:hypothetical protein TcCL_Unassigned00914 [Trypanosoma cruzi]